MHHKVFAKVLSKNAQPGGTVDLTLRVVLSIRGAVGGLYVNELNAVLHMMRNDGLIDFGGPSLPPFKVRLRPALYEYLKTRRIKAA